MKQTQYCSIAKLQAYVFVDEHVFVDIGVGNAPEKSTMRSLSAQHDCEEGEHEANNQPKVHVQNDRREESDHPNHL